MGKIRLDCMATCNGKHFLDIGYRGAILPDAMGTDIVLCKVKGIIKWKVRRKAK